MKRLSHYQGFIFDLDGTLADSMQEWDSICRDWIVAKGLTPPVGLEDAISLMTLQESAAYMLELYPLPLSVEDIIGEWTGMVERRYMEHVPFKPGAREFLLALHGQGKKLAVATSCFPEICESFLGKQGVRKLFSAIVYTDGAVRDKTFPDVYLEAARRLGLPPESCVVFEDLYPALQGVKGAGMGFVAVWDPFYTQWDKMCAEADIAVKDFEEFLR